MPLSGAIRGLRPLSPKVRLEDEDMMLGEIGIQLLLGVAGVEAARDATVRRIVPCETKSNFLTKLQHGV
ncbi:hypothetical protein ACRE_021050 [Hapsidospora chrysogenum ATCC 11550]|uniref:Uncharacterized protein n=1 Tax=Hapsidospora chrysogenum (strain ATCC 11550 / CBS 779.69 / DSM 880 / IAM 14645 / JCM 23072 / IMI 49137) TaxID=857340 RepID=A0A086TCF3_HAPC1|nr:hypothetical protein ACRE_021050 [Hapsidospora chrysogenum ATCC 11550]